MLLINPLGDNLEKSMERKQFLQKMISQNVTHTSKDNVISSLIRDNRKFRIAFIQEYYAKLFSSYESIRRDNLSDADSFSRFEKTELMSAQTLCHDFNLWWDWQTEQYQLWLYRSLKDKILDHYFGYDNLGKVGDVLQTSDELVWWEQSESLLSALSTIQPLSEDEVIQSIVRKWETLIIEWYRNRKQTIVINLQRWIVWYKDENYFGSDLFLWGQLNPQYANDKRESQALTILTNNPSFKKYCTVLEDDNLNQKSGKLVIRMKYDDLW